MSNNSFEIVDFPQPDGPTKATISPLLMVNDALSKMRGSLRP